MKREKVILSQKMREGATQSRMAASLLNNERKWDKYKHRIWEHHYVGSLDASDVLRHTKLLYEHKHKHPHHSLNIFNDADR